MLGHCSDTFEGVVLSNFLTMFFSRIGVGDNVDLCFLQFCSRLMSAYGVAPVALSPPLTWMPLLLLGAAAYCTMLRNAKP